MYEFGYGGCVVYVVFYFFYVFGWFDGNVVGVEDDVFVDESDGLFVGFVVLLLYDNEVWWLDRVLFYGKKCVYVEFFYIFFV